METGGWNYAKRRGSWSAPVVRQLFEGQAAEAYGACAAVGCMRRSFLMAREVLALNCRPICERAVEARLRSLGTGATRPNGGM